MSSTSGYIETAAPPGKNSRFYVEWNLIGQDIGNNTSTIQWRAGLNISRYDLWYNNAVRIDGGNVHTQGIGNGTWSNLGPGKHQLRNGQVTIQHNGDGSGAFGAGINGWLYSFGNRSTNGSWNLPTIPRATNPSMPGSFMIGSPVTINLPRASGSFHHRVFYNFNGMSGQISSNAGTSVVWNSPSALANTRPNNESGTGTITVETWNGGSHIGTRTIGFTAVVPNTSSFLPIIESYAVTEDNENVSDQFSFFVQGKSRLALSMVAKGAFSSTITHTNFIFENWVSDGKQPTAVSPIITGYGQRFIGFITQDSRSRSNEDLTFTSVDVEEYVDPFVTMALSRADSTGAWDEDGNHVIIYPGALIAPLRNENTHAFMLRYKKRDATTWIELPITPTGGATYGEYQLDLQDDAKLISGIDVDSAYDFELVATDYFTTSRYAAVIPTAFTMMDFHASGRSVSFGKVATNANRFEIGPKIPLNIIAATSTEADKDLTTFRRSDDTLLGKFVTGPNGQGIKAPQYDTSGLFNGDFVFLGAHPVNSIFESAASDNPGALYGGTWIREGQEIERKLLTTKILHWSGTGQGTTSRAHRLGVYSHDMLTLMLEGNNQPIEIPSGYHAEYKLHAEVSTDAANKVRLYLNNIYTQYKGTYSGDTFRVSVSTNFFKKEDIVLETTTGYTSPGINFGWQSDNNVNTIRVYLPTLSAYLVRDTPIYRWRRTA